MKSCLPALIYPCFALVLSGCETLFHADFESDTAGGPPSSSPAGPPTDDVIRIWPADPPNIVVIADRLFGNSLSHSYREAVSQTDFIAIETTRAVQEFTALWDGCADRFSSATPRFFFAIGNLNTGIANIEIVDGEFRASGERLGDVVFGEVHTVSVHVDNSAGTYTATIAQAAPTSGGSRAACSTAGVSRPACPEDFRFERGECRTGPNWLGYRAHCPLEGRTGCATCRADEVLDTMNGTCVTRSRARDRVMSSARPLSSRGAEPSVSRVSIKLSYDNVVPGDPASYVIDDIWIYRPEE
ncbi:MAG TPA: hypothetical protein VLB07_00620 [Woeseiaceae bacterium]|nr:hypothetical protein [Woeseiaceae bacterium]